MADFRKRYWIKFYPSEPVDHKAKSVLARGLRDYLWGQCAQTEGLLVKNCQSRDKAVDTLLAGLGAHDHERDAVRQYLLDWIEDGYLTMERHNGRYQISVTDYQEGQEGNAKRNVPGVSGNASSTARVRKHREAKRRAAEQKALENQLALPPAVAPQCNAGETFHETHKEREKERNKEREILDVSLLARSYLSDPTSVAAQAGPPHTWGAVREVVDAWNQLWDQRVAPQNSGDPRIQVIVGRLAESYTVEALVDAIRGSLKDDWLGERNQLHSLKHVLRDGDAVDGFRRLLQEPKRIASVKPGRAGPIVQPSVESGYYDRRESAEAEPQDDGEEDIPLLMKRLTVG